MNTWFPWLALVAWLPCGCSSQASTDPARGAIGDGGEAPDAAPSACSNPARPPEKYFPDMVKIGGRGVLTFQLVESVPAPPQLGSNALTIKIHRSDGSAFSGDLRVSRSIARSNLLGGPAITFDPLASMYTLSPVDLPIVGVWRIRLDAYDGGASVDAVSFDFCIEEPARGLP